MMFWDLMQVTLSIDLPGLGSRIRKAREIKGLTPTQVGALSGMSTANLYRIENEESKSLPRETLKRLCAALEVDFDAEVREALAREADA